MVRSCDRHQRLRAESALTKDDPPAPLHSLYPWPPARSRRSVSQAHMFYSWVRARRTTEVPRATTSVTVRRKISTKKGTSQGALLYSLVTCIPTAETSSAVGAPKESTFTRSTMLLRASRWTVVLGLADTVATFQVTTVTSISMLASTAATSGDTESGRSGSPNGVR